MGATRAYEDGTGEELIVEIRDLGEAFGRLNARIAELEQHMIEAWHSSVAGEWRTRVRVNVAKTATKGYTPDTTVEVEWMSSGDEPAAMDGTAAERLRDWLEDADNIARNEIERREKADTDGA
jgi:hypothetical protein